MTGVALVQHARDQLLAGAALAGHQHGRVAARHHVDEPGHPPHRGRLPDQRHLALAPRQLDPRLLQLHAQGPVLGDAMDLQQQLVDVEGLGQVVERTLLQGRDRVRHLRVGSHEDHVGARRLLTDAPEQREAVDLRQAHVADDDVEHLRERMIQPLGAVAGDHHSVIGVS